jgi:glucose/arabinose dehydrogenase
MLLRPALVLAVAALAASPFGDFRSQKPGARHHIRARDLPPPAQAEDASNGPDLIARPEGARPLAPKGFVVEPYATGLDAPRQVKAAPNGDLFVAESYAGRLRVVRGFSADGKARTTAVFARGLRKPFGVAFYPPGASPKWLYVADTDAVLRVPYESGDLKARGKFEKVLSLPGGGLLEGGGGGHWTRDLAFTPDGKTLLVSVGSRSNVSDDPGEKMRAAVLAATPEGRDLRVYASGLRNPVTLAVRPGTSEVWTTVNERDRLGDNLPPDYIARVREGGFYGWPWFYIGGHQDPRHAGRHPELRETVLVPEVLIQPHNASLGLVFYDGTQFPEEYRGDAFAAEHGSWNRRTRTGYELIRVRFRGGRATGEYEDFVTGFVTQDGRVWGRPVGVAVAADGSLVFSDDAGGLLWRVRREAAAAASPRP